MAPPKGPNLNRRKHKDPDIHKKYVPFLRARAQANFRNEEWTLTFEDFLELWPEDLWNQRGHEKHNYSMGLVDLKGGWHRHNVQVCPRIDLLTRVKGPYKDRKIDLGPDPL